MEVIPEIDMPGHGHAAIKAMEARFLKLLSRDPVEAKRYFMTQPSIHILFFICVLVYFYSSTFVWLVIFVKKTRLTNVYDNGA